jgi:rare lipoprotein A
MPLAALVLLNGCASGCAGGGSGYAASLAQQANGPAADYPVVIGEPFTIDGVTHTPTDQLNYDAVGYASVAPQDGVAVSASHKTLPLPSYAEVTSLDSGRTILVRVENRGPMANDLLLQLSPGAAVQLGFGDGDKTAVRVRRVNPPEVERAMLRAGKQVPERMETPQALLKVLNRKLAENGPLSARPAPKPDLAASIELAAVDTADKQAEQAQTSTVLSAAETRPAQAEVPTNPAESAKPAGPHEPAAKPEQAKPVEGGLVVQVAAFSTQDRADGVASKLGAKVSKPGKYWLVRLGPYGSRGDASTGLAKARAAGYSDARIQSVN